MDFSIVNARQEVDRKQWADYVKVEFVVDLEGTGEAVTQTFHFGRAFDRPPEFDWSSFYNQRLCQGSMSVVVAASDASPISKRKADLICTGTDDQETVYLASQMLDSWGTIFLTEGSFSFSDTLNLRYVNLLGAGKEQTFITADFDDFDWAQFYVDYYEVPGSWANAPRLIELADGGNIHGMTIYNEETIGVKLTGVYETTLSDLMFYGGSNSAIIYSDGFAYAVNLVNISAIGAGMIYMNNANNVNVYNYKGIGSGDWWGADDPGDCFLFVNCDAVHMDQIEMIGCGSWSEPHRSACIHFKNTNDIWIENYYIIGTPNYDLYFEDSGIINVVRGSVSGGDTGMSLFENTNNVFMGGVTSNTYVDTSTNPYDAAVAIVDSSRVTIQNVNYTTNHNWSTTADAIGIYNSDNVKIDGCNFYKTEGSFVGYWRNVIYIDAQSNNSTVIRNDVRSVDYVLFVDDDGTGTAIEGNFT